MKMHPDQLHVDEEIVRQLIAEQFPLLGDENVGHIDGGGTVNAIFRIGEDFAARFPLNPGNPNELAAELRKVAAAMEELAGVCPVPTPVHVAHGNPGPGYPMPWSVQSWLPGCVATPMASRTPWSSQEICFSSYAHFVRPTPADDASRALVAEATCETRTIG